MPVIVVKSRCAKAHPMGLFGRCALRCCGVPDHDAIETSAIDEPGLSKRCSSKRRPNKHG
jgi:hypothetical protein